VARAEAYLHAKFHLNPSNRLATVHERYRQTDRTDRQVVAVFLTLTFHQVAARLRWCGGTFYYRSTAKSASERILKIVQHLAMLEAKI